MQHQGRDVHYCIPVIFNQVLLLSLVKFLVRVDDFVIESIKVDVAVEKAKSLKGPFFSRGQAKLST